MNDSEQLLIARINDAVSWCENRNAPKFIGFLNADEYSCALMYADKNCLHYAAFGGYEGAERVIFALLPEWADENIEYPISAVSFDYKSGYELSHRDFLGTFMSLGITREKVGDIIVDKGHTVAFFHKDVEKYAVSQIEKVGGVGVIVSPGCKDEIHIEQQYVPIQATVASARLDCIVGAICNTSREKASQLINGKSVFINNTMCVDVAHKINNQTVITIRSKGKYVIDSLDNVTKKGRVVLIARKKV